MTALLSVENLHTYYGASHVLQGINLSILPGQAVALMGRNGMGKTTTVRSLFGLTPPRHGSVLLDGVDVSGWRTDRIARAGLALAPEGRGIFANLSVRENLTMAARPSTGEGGWTLDRVLALFPRLAERLSHMGNQLSGGEQQMLSIGRALMTNPKLLALDEATEGLAPLIRKEIWSVIRQIKDSGLATLIVDKDLAALLRVCEHCVIIEKGRVVYDNSAEHLAAHPEIHERYIGI